MKHLTSALLLLLSHTLFADDSAYKELSLKQSAGIKFRLERDFVFAPGKNSVVKMGHTSYNFRDDGGSTKSVSSWCRAIAASGSEDKSRAIPKGTILTIKRPKIYSETQHATGRETGIFYMVTPYADLTQITLEVNFTNSRKRQRPLLVECQKQANFDRRTGRNSERMSPPNVGISINDFFAINESYIELVSIPDIKELENDGGIVEY
jgi:hypothetical protein